MRKSIDAQQARKDAEAAFALAFTYRDSDAYKSVIAYLDARLAYYQASLVDAGDSTPEMQAKAKTTKSLLTALSNDAGKPRAVV